jgi:hypothetical protein
MRQATLVAYNGSKPTALAEVIHKCQQMVKARAGGRFHPYGMEQVHATILGLERVDGRFNRNFAEHRGERKEMDVVGFSEYLQMPGALPFEVQFGGFPDRDFPFTSQGDPKPDEELIRVIECEVRDTLSAGEPVSCTIDAASLRVVSYLDETLPPATSVSSPISDIRARDCFDSLLAGVPPPKAETAGKLGRVADPDGPALLLGDYKPRLWSR